MNAQTFLDNFGYIANAPNGINSLRQLVMASALMGKFSLPNDELPEDIDSILEENRRDYLESLDKREKPLLFGAPLLQHFELPTGWTWVRVGQICDLQTGATPSRQRPEYFGGDIRWLVSGDINLGEISECEGRITKEGLENSNCKVIPKNSVMIALNGQGKTRATVALLRVPAACNQSLVAMIPYSSKAISPEYLFLALKYRYYEIRDITGQKQRRGLNMNLVSELSVPLAPIAEQKRIVAKVDELMALCDKLEALQQKREKLCELTRTASINALTSAKSPQELEISWGRVRKNTSILFDKPGSAKGLEQAIRQLAVLGKLVPQIDREPPVTSNIEKQVVAERKQQGLPVNPGRFTQTIYDKAVSELSFPEKWRVPPLALATLTIVDCPHSTPKWTERGKICVRTNQFSPGKLNLSASRYVSDDTYKQRVQRLTPRSNDILYSREGGILGVACLIPEGVELCLGQRMMLIRCPSILAPRFAEIVLNSPFVVQIATQSTTGGAAPRVNVATVKSYPLPIPPLSEQRRIIAKVDRLIALVEMLEAHLSQQQTMARNLAVACVASITGTQIKEQEKMKAPKMELVSKLNIGSSPKPKDQAPLTSLLTKNKGELSAKALWSYSGLEIDEFYQQLKTEMANGWIIEPEKAVMREVTAD